MMEFNRAGDTETEALRSPFMVDGARINFSIKQLGTKENKKEKKKVLQSMQKIGVI